MSRTYRITGQRARTVGLAIAGLSLVVALASCGLFSLSPYPLYVSLARNSVDLSAGALDGYGMDRKIIVESDGTHTFVYLIERDSSVTGGPVHLVVMDENLKVLYDGEDSRFGTLHLVDASGDFVIGTMRFDPNASPLSFEPVPFGSGVDVYPYDRAFYDGTKYRFFGLNIASGSFPQLIETQTVSADWSTSSGGAVAYDLTNIDSGTSYYIDRYQFDQKYGTLSISMSTPSGDAMISFNSAKFSTLSAPLFTNYGVKLAGGASAYQVFHTRRGAVYLDYDDQLVAVTKGGDYIPLALHNHGETSYGFPEDGTSFYLYDVSSQRMYRCSTWW